MEELIKSMNVQERVELMKMILQSLDNVDEEEYIDDDEEESEEELNILRERWADYEANPEDTVSFEEFKDRMLKKYNGGKEI